MQTAIDNPRNNNVSPIVHQHAEDADECNTAPNNSKMLNILMRFATLPIEKGLKTPQKRVATCSRM